MTTVNSSMQKDAAPIVAGPRYEARVSEQVQIREPAKRRLRLREVFRSGQIIRVLAMRDLRAKYKQSALGPLWLLIQPLGMLAAFTVVFDGITDVNTAGIPYPLFGLVGLCVWSYFQMAVSLGSEAIAGNATFIKRVPLPRVVLPISSMIVAAPLLASTVALTLAANLIFGSGLPLRALLLPVCLIWLFLLVLGIVALISAVTAVVRDVRGMLPFMLQAGLFLSPIAYPISEASEGLVWALSANPVTGVVEFWRWVLLPGAQLELIPVLVAVGLTVILLVVGWRVFTRLEVSFADVA